MEYLMLQIDFRWVNEKNSLIVALLLAVSGLVTGIIILWKSSNKKDAVIVELARESIAAMKGVEAGTTIGSQEHREIQHDLERVDDKLNNILVNVKP